MKKETIVEMLKGYNKEHVEAFSSYIIKLIMARKKDGSIENAWIQNRREEDVVVLFKRVAEEGLVFDGIHITLQSTGISYDYVAYKNKMLLAYPESKVDVNLVYKGDDFQVSKESGSVIYHHNIKNPFGQKEEEIEGGYCVISNKRGDFLTLLSKEEIDKHRKVAKTDFIWRAWFKEMALKTIIKKAIKYHFADIYEKIETEDNENYNLDNPLDIELSYKQEIDAIENLEDLKNYYFANKGRGKEFDKYIVIRKEQINQSLIKGGDIIL